MTTIIYTVVLFILLITVLVLVYQNFKKSAKIKYMNTKMDDYNQERDDLRKEVVNALKLNDSVFKKLHKMYGMAYDLQKGGTTLIAEGYDGTNKDEVINSIIDKELITPYVGFNLQKGTAKLVIVDGEDVNKWVNQLNGIQKEMIDHSTATQSYVQRALTENI